MVLRKRALRARELRYYYYYYYYHHHHHHHHHHYYYHYYYLIAKLFKHASFLLRNMDVKN